MEGSLTHLPISQRLTILAEVKKGLVALVVGVVLASCGSGSNGSDHTEELTVFAASSLTEALPELGDAFTADHAGARFTFSFGSSSDLAAQILEGAPVDLFASADDANMQKIVNGGEGAATPTSVGRNTFSIIVAAGNPLGITSIADLTDPDLIVVTCVETAPCGSGALAIFANAGVSITPKSFEEKVKGVVTKVVSGEADAGIVYVTDVLAVGHSADGVSIPIEINVTTDYAMAVTKSSDHSALAQAFIDFIASDAGQAILAKFGFLAP